MDGLRKVHGFCFRNRNNSSDYLQDMVAERGKAQSFQNVAD